MEAERHQQENIKELSVYRRLLAVAGGFYFSWWFAVELVLPKSFNPILSRFFVVAVIFGVLWISFINAWVGRHIRLIFIICLWLITLHYYYLFYGNQGDVNWVVGAYITVIAINLCFFTNFTLFLYSIYVVFLSLVLLFLVPQLKHSVFLPGLITIVFQANIGMRSRFKILKRAEKERIATQAMAESVRVRDEFISIASHELKTPLTSLKLQGQFIDTKINSPSDFQNYPYEKIKKFISLINRQTERLNRLVETMLDVSRISTGKITLDQKNIDLVALVREIVDFSEGLSGEISLAIETPEPLLVFGDQHRLEQVVENLLTNAIKYGNGKSIGVTIKFESTDVLLIVKDQGLGIAAENIKRIFNRFERAISAQNISGLGLGLYITKQIVEAHRGTISVESTLGVGSTFTVKLPIK